MSQQEQFKGYSEGQMKRIASKLGHTGDLNSFNSYLSGNPTAKAKFFKFKTATTQRYAQGGAVRKGRSDEGATMVVDEARDPSNGGVVMPGTTIKENTIYAPVKDADGTILQTGLEQTAIERALDPGLMKQARTIATSTGYDANQAIATTSGQVGATDPKATVTKAGTSTATMPNTYDIPVTMAERKSFEDLQTRSAALNDELGGIRPEDWTEEQRARVNRIKADASNIDIARIQRGQTNEGQQNEFNTANKSSLANYDPATAQQAVKVGNGTGNQQTTATFNPTHDDISTAKSATDVKGVTDKVSGATGTVTDTVQAQQGNINTLAEAQTGTAGTVGDTEALKVTDGQMVKAAEGETTSSEAQTSGSSFETDAATFESPTPEALAANAYELEKTKAAEMGEYLVMDPAKAGTIPEAKVVQSDTTSGVVAQERNISNKELVDVTDLQLDEPVAAVAATMNALNDEAKMIAQKGTFSQELASDRQGAVSAASTMAGQMESLMNQFNDGTPAWAAGALRNANAAMAARGMGASSMAGAALVQAAMESAMPIAQNDAAAFAAMDMANLNNRQQTSLANAAAQQNLSLTNLSNEQQAALQNSTNAFSLQSESLSNLQSVVLSNQQVKYATQGKNLDVKTQTSLANAAKYAEVNNINLSNSQQSNLAKSAENLTVDMSNLSNGQQTALSNLQVRASLKGQELTNEQQMAVLESTESFEASKFDATTQQAAFMQDAAADAAMKGQVLSNEQQTALFNVSSQLSERELTLNNEQQTRLYNTTNAMSMEVTNLSNKQQTALANAQIDAAVKGQELSNKQQTNVLNAARISEIANVNFTAEQDKAIQNSQLAQTMDLANLSNKQATQLANVATLANMDMANLNNRQQAEVQNAKSFLDIDMANLNNEQQATMFKAQSRISSIMSDKGAENATKQFNATSANQVDQFYDNMASTMSQFNSAQKNAQEQFNAGEATAVSKFNAEMKNNRDQFNSTNRLAVDQSNATWRREIATTDTAALNRANEIDARAVLDISNTAYNDLWQEHRDEMDWVYEISEGEADRVNELARAIVSAEASKAVAGEATDTATSTAIGGIVTSWILED